MKRLALIGFGAIGREIAAGLMPVHHLGIHLRPGSPSIAAIPDGVASLSNLDELLAFAPDLVIEAAGHQVVQELVPACLEHGRAVLITSIGALHDARLSARLVAAAEAGATRLVLPSGALGGLDYVRAARFAPDLAVHYTSTKPPSAWQGELERLGHDPDGLEVPVVLFDGDAREAAARYPLNLNVAAALAWAGHGFEATRVSIICDPGAAGNTHAIVAESALGRLRLEIVNAPSPANPKTSAIVARSVLAAVDQFFGAVQVL